MSIIATVEKGSRAEDWLFVGIVLAIAYLVVYPVYIFILRSQHARRIKRQLVTSEYKLPTKMTPTELSYVFSSNIKKQHLYATLLDLANRSIVVLKQKEGRIFVESGPKIEKDLTLSEALLTDYIFEANRPIPVDQVIVGHTEYDQKNQKISGSRHYVFWWLLRQQLRDKKIIEKHMTGRYTKMLFNFGALASLALSLFSVGLWRLVEMLDSGEVDFDVLCKHWQYAFWFWLIALIPILLISFFMLRLRGKMLGRHWLLTKRFRRYMNQLIAFKEYVRLSHNQSLRFESRELKKESSIRTKPYAIALGFVDDISSGK